MPISTLQTPGGAFRVRIDGPEGAPALVLSNSLGTTLEMWDAQAERFAMDYRVVRYDTRGHGGSVVSPGPYSFEQLGGDVIALLDALQIARASFCGISMGGFTGLWLGVNVPQRLNHLVVANSAAKIGTADGWTARAALVREKGAAAMDELADSSPSRWFTEAFIAQQPDAVRRAQGWIADLAPEGYAACCEALAQADLRSAIDTITVPTLLIAGAFDPVTTVADAQAMQTAIAGAQLAKVSASHLSNLEAPSEFDAALAAFLAR
ncbi:3-oxoadipate enol-lactonase [Acidovorax sp. 69]|uniref:3-oxoadipate enol-lactonase n=1 Tax=Acidovorax sp. 69 TaxID=2035202 RepID=UPI000C237C7F|nr:3-oxoadipate enol-lactonase [Acidovorax sp. 69]PJI96314.1 3-oxoadipate enol-lactonase [Acidovorax sp. 69]